MIQKKQKILIVGGGGREASFARKLQEDSFVYAVMPFKNPTIIKAVTDTQGQYKIADVKDPIAVREFASKHNIDLAFVSADDPLSCGVVDELLKYNIKTVGGTKEATRIEWDKVYSIKVMQEVCPSFTPFFVVVDKKEQINDAITKFKEKNKQIVVKPQGLTGGKGVKVMPEHLEDFVKVEEYILELLTTKPNEKVLLMEKIDGFEFTIMGITDGESLSLAPATYDYPFRFENDTGPGTGGMGCFTQSDGLLPFLNENDIKTCYDIMLKTIKKINEKNIIFNGVLNGGFFKNEFGIFFMEYNARFGDPEALNVVPLIKGSFTQLLFNLYNKNLAKNPISYLEKSSVVKYLVAKEYPDKSPCEIIFDFDYSKITKENVEFLCSACVQDENKYKTLKSSRILALLNIDDDVKVAAKKINKVIKGNFKENMHFRYDIGLDLQKLKLE
jgi:phosphoribosylamine---glycine ligase